MIPDGLLSFGFPALGQATVKRIAASLLASVCRVASLAGPSRAQTHDTGRHSYGATDPVARPPRGDDRIRRVRRRRVLAMTLVAKSRRRSGLRGNRPSLPTDIGAKLDFGHSSCVAERVGDAFAEGRAEFCGLPNAGT